MAGEFSENSQDYIDANDAVGVLTACAADVDLLEQSLPKSKKTAGFQRAVASLRARIAVGQAMKDARRDR